MSDGSVLTFCFAILIVGAACKPCSTLYKMEVDDHPLKHIRELLAKESKGRALSERGNTLYRCLADCMSSLLRIINRQNMSREDLKELEKLSYAKHIQKNVVSLLQNHANNFKTVLPLFIDDLRLEGQLVGDNAKADYEKLLDEIYTEIIEDCTYGDFSIPNTKLCLYASATLINVPIFVIADDLQWLVFEPLFRYEHQPECVSSFITMYMQGNMFHNIESRDRYVPPPEARGYIGMYMSFLDDCEVVIPQHCIDALCRLDKAICEKNQSVAVFVEACHLGGRELNERRQTVSNTVIASSVVGIASGGLVIAGILLAPVSFGASLGLSIAGGALGIGSGITAGTARTLEAVRQNSKMGEIQRMQADIEEKEMQVSVAMEAVENAYKDTIPIKNVSKAAGVLRVNTAWFLPVGSVLRSAKGIASIVFAAARFGSTAATITAAALGPLSLVFDVAFLIDAARDKIKGDKTAAGKLLENLAELVVIKCKIFNNVMRGNYSDGHQLLSIEDCRLIMLPDPETQL